MGVWCFFLGSWGLFGCVMYVYGCVFQRPVGFSGGWLVGGVVSEGIEGGG